MGKKMAAAYLGILFFVFIWQMILLNGPIKVLMVLGIIGVLMSVMVAFIILLEE